MVMVRSYSSGLREAMLTCLVVSVHEVFVDFVSQDEDVFAQGHFSQGAQFFF